MFYLFAYFISYAHSYTYMQITSIYWFTAQMPATVGAVQGCAGSETSRAGDTGYTSHMNGSNTSHAVASQGPH